MILILKCHDDDNDHGGDRDGDGDDCQGGPEFHSLCRRRGTHTHDTLSCCIFRVSVSPPTFVFMTNNPDKTNFAYERYIANQFRHHFGFEGTPLKFIWRKKKSTHGRKSSKSA